MAVCPFSYWFDCPYSEKEVKHNVVPCHVVVWVLDLYSEYLKIKPLVWSTVVHLSRALVLNSFSEHSSV